MKTYVITLSKKFPINHNRKGLLEKFNESRNSSALSLEINGSTYYANQENIFAFKILQFLNSENLS